MEAPGRRAAGRVLELAELLGAVYGSTAIGRSAGSASQFRLDPDAVGQQHLFGGPVAAPQVRVDGNVQRRRGRPTSSAGTRAVSVGWSSSRGLATGRAVDEGAPVVSERLRRSTLVGLPALDRFHARLRSTSGVIDRESRYKRSAP